MPTLIIIEDTVLDELIAKAEQDYQSAQIGIAGTMAAVKYETLLEAKDKVLSLSKPAETVIDFVGRTFIMMGENSWAYQVEDSAKGTYDVRLTTQEVINKSL